MGTNDHLPNKSQRTARRRRNEPVIVLTWGADELAQVAPFIEKVSEQGGYVGLGRNTKGDCLLIYVKLNDWQERIPIEDTNDLAATIDDLLQEF